MDVGEIKAALEGGVRPSDADLERLQVRLNGWVNILLEHEERGEMGTPVYEKRYEVGFGLLCGYELLDDLPPATEAAA